MGHWTPWPDVDPRNPVGDDTAPARAASDVRSALLQRVALGDEAAFAQLYDETAAEVYGVARRVARDPAFAEDIAQETFVDVWRRAPGFEPTRGSATVWILTIAHRRAVDRVRREESARRRDEHVAVREPDVSDDVAGTLERRLDQERVARALASLTPIQRQAVELAYYGGHTQQQIARLLDVPLGTVKTRIRDGMIRLRDAFEVTP